MEKDIKNFNVRVSESTFKEIVSRFKTNKITTEKQDEYIKKTLFLEVAKQLGFTPEILSGIKEILRKYDFSLQPSDLLYSKNPAEKLQDKFKSAKKEINSHLSYEKNNSKQNLKTEKAQQKNPLNFAFDRKLLAVMCMSTEEQGSMAVHNIATTKLLAQGMSQEELYKNVSVIEIGKPPLTQKLTFNPPKRVIDIIVEQAEKNIKRISNMVYSGNQLLNILQTPGNTKNPDLKLIVMCHLKECSIQEFKDLINRREVKDLFNEKEWLRLKRSREQEAASKDVVESGEQVKKKLSGKDDEPLSDEEKSKIEQYGIDTEGLSVKEIRDLINDTELTLTMTGLSLPSLVPHS